MDDSVKSLSKKDMLVALRNAYLQQLIENEVSVKFYKWKEKNLSNGQSLKMVKDNLINAERNVSTMTQKIAIVSEMLGKA